MLSMRTKLPFMRAKGLISLLALLPFSVLTTDQAWRATLGEQKNHTRLIRCGFDPSDIHMVFRAPDHDGGLSFDPFFHGDKIRAFSPVGFDQDLAFWPVIEHSISFSTALSVITTHGEVKGWLGRLDSYLGDKISLSQVGSHIYFTWWAAHVWTQAMSNRGGVDMGWHYYLWPLMHELLAKGAWEFACIACFQGLRHGFLFIMHVWRRLGQLQKSPQALLPHHKWSGSTVSCGQNVRRWS